MGIKKTVIITAKVHEHLSSALAKKGYDIRYVPQVSYDELYEMGDEATGLIVTTRLPIDKKLIDRAVQLKWIGRLGSGMELIDVEYAESKGITCVNSPEGNRTAVAEHALGMLLSLLHRINSSYEEVRSGKWLREENRGEELTGKTVGIIGFGNTGAAFAKLLASFDNSVLIYDKYKFGFSSQYIKEATLDQVCRHADVISFHVPLTPETFHMADSTFFGLLQQKPIIINTARGGVIEISALKEAIKKEKVSGVALDVFEHEQTGDLPQIGKENMDFLLGQKNVLLTPHIAGYSHQAFYRMGQVILEKLGI